MYAFVEAHNVPFRMAGKLVVAVRKNELERLDALFERAVANGCDVRRVDGAQVRDIEPSVTSAVGGIYSPCSGVTDYGLVCEKLASLLAAHNATLRFGAPLTAALPTMLGWSLVLGNDVTSRVDAKFLVTCAGLQSDRVVRLCGGAIEPRIVPVRSLY